MSATSSKVVKMMMATAAIVFTAMFVVFGVAYAATHGVREQARLAVNECGDGQVAAVTRTSFSCA